MSMPDDELEAVKTVYTRIHGKEEGFDVAFSPGTKLAEMTGAELLQRLRISEPFQVDAHLQPPNVYHERLIDNFLKMEDATFIETVDDGEFAACTDLLLQCLAIQDDIHPNRTPALVLERCRRGGKTFMLSAVAKNLAEIFKGKGKDVHVVQISLNSATPFQASETALNAIYSRIAYFIANPRDRFPAFRKKYSDFCSVGKWIEQNDVILLIDELNVIPNNAKGYDEMSAMLDSHMAFKGGALLYSTHHRIEQDLLRGRKQGSASQLSLRKHRWMSIPRIETEDQLIHKGTFHFGFSSAVLRARIPSLICLDQFDITEYAPQDDKMFEDRHHAMGAVLTGDANGLKAGRDLLRSYSYRGKGTQLLLWPPFLIAQQKVLGKNCPPLRVVLEDPEVNEAKAFEGLVELSVITRLLSDSKNSHKFVPRHQSVSDDNSFDATEIIHVHKRNEDIVSLRKAVENAFPRSTAGHVRQVVAIPLYDQFPKYDFFLLNRRGRFQNWSVKVGYQCKTTRSYPDKKHAAETKQVRTSVWVEGKCPGSRTKDKTTHGWEMMDDAELQNFLGASFYHALEHNSL
jgi:hypothetical protein